MTYRAKFAGGLLVDQRTRGRRHDGFVHDSVSGEEIP